MNKASDQNWNTRAAAASLPDTESGDPTPAPDYPLEYAEAREKQEE